MGYNYSSADEVRFHIVVTMMHQLLSLLHCPFLTARPSRSNNTGLHNSVCIYNIFKAKTQSKHKRSSRRRGMPWILCSTSGNDMIMEWVEHGCHGCHFPLWGLEFHRAFTRSCLLKQTTQRALFISQCCYHVYLCVTSPFIYIYIYTKIWLLTPLK